jgi:hypothetical protein
MRAEMVESSGGHVAVRGSVCRSAFTPPPPRYVRLERLGADGAALEARTTPIRAMPGYRGGCGFFSFADALGEGESARLAALRWGG